MASTARAKKPASAATSTTARPGTAAKPTTKIRPSTAAAKKAPLESKGHTAALDALKLASKNIITEAKFSALAPAKIKDIHIKIDGTTTIVVLIKILALNNIISPAATLPKDAASIAFSAAYKEAQELLETALDITARSEGLSTEIKQLSEKNEITTQKLALAEAKTSADTTRISQLTSEQSNMANKISRIEAENAELKLTTEKQKEQLRLKEMSERDALLKVQEKELEFRKLQALFDEKAKNFDAIALRLSEATQREADTMRKLSQTEESVRSAERSLEKFREHAKDEERRDRSVAFRNGEGMYQQQEGVSATPFRPTYSSVPASALPAHRGAAASHGTRFSATTVAATPAPGMYTKVAANPAPGASLRGESTVIDAIKFPYFTVSAINFLQYLDLTICKNQGSTTGNSLEKFRHNFLMAYVDEKYPSVVTIITTIQSSEDEFKMLDFTPILPQITEVDTEERFGKLTTKLGTASRGPQGTANKFHKLMQAAYSSRSFNGNNNAHYAGIHSRSVKEEAPKGALSTLNRAAVITTDVTPIAAHLTKPAVMPSA